MKGWGGARRRKDGYKLPVSLRLHCSLNVLFCSFIHSFTLRSLFVNPGRIKTPIRPCAWYFTTLSEFRPQNFRPPFIHEHVKPQVKSRLGLNPHSQKEHSSGVESWWTDERFPKSELMRVHQIFRLCKLKFDQKTYSFSWGEHWVYLWNHNINKVCLHNNSLNW